MAHPTRIFEKPEELEKAWEEYKQSLEKEAKKWLKVQYVGKDGNRVTDPPKLPLILKGFYLWYRKKTGHYIHQYFDNQQGNFDDFMVICRAIRDEIEVDHITGGMLNMYNPSITQRLHGLTDKQEIKQGVIKIEGLPEDLDKLLEDG